MRFRGQVFKSGKYWAIEVPILDIATQGRTKREAYEMIADAVESLVNRKDFRVRVFEADGNEFEIGTSDPAALVALLLKRARLKAGLSLGEVAARLGSKSANSYARYEQGRSVPSIAKLARLYSVVAPSGAFVIMESRARYK
jgi:DNA-binding transcriptional regulator YiaG